MKQKKRKIDKTFEQTLVMNIKIKPQLSWIDALKLRLAGGKEVPRMWISIIRALNKPQEKKK